MAKSSQDTLVWVVNSLAQQLPSSHYFYIYFYIHRPCFSLSLSNMHHNNFTEENNLSSELMFLEYCLPFALWFLNMPSHIGIHIHIRYLLIICDHPFTLQTAEVRCEETREESLFLCPLICIHTVISPCLSLPLLISSQTLYSYSCTHRPLE